MPDSVKCIFNQGEFALCLYQPLWQGAYAMSYYLLLYIFAIKSNTYCHFVCYFRVVLVIRNDKNELG